MKKITILLLSFLCLQANAQSLQSGPYIAVIGEATEKYMPDMVNFIFLLEVNNKKQLDAVKQLNKQVSLFIKTVESLGIDSKQIELSDYGLDENTEYQNGKQKKVGYKATERFDIKMKYSDEMYARFVDSISNTKFININFTYQSTFSDSLQNEIKKELITKASKNASEMAKALAKSQNVTLGDIFSIEYTENNASFYGIQNSPTPPPSLGDMSVAYEEVPTSLLKKVSMKAIESSQQVRVVYRIAK